MAKQIRLDDNQYQALILIKKRDGIPLAESVRRAIAEYLRDKSAQDSPQSNG